jgi:phage terminase large subunit-like protein
MRLFGWRAPSGLRRFLTSYLEIAKKNGKSTLISAIALLLLIADCEGAPEVYLNAVDRSQANIVYEEAVRMVKASPGLRSRLQVIESRGVIVDPANYGKIQKNSADAPSKDGINPSGTIFDELHRFKTRSLWDVFQYASVAREQPLRIVITTAGEEEDGVWFEQRDYSEKVNAGLVPDVTHLGIVYRAERTDDLDSPETWRKANPSLGVTISEEGFRRELAKAKETPSEWGNFLRLRLNIVVAGETRFLRIEDWDRCKDPPVVEPGEPFLLGLDLSDTQDLTALAQVAGDLYDGIHARMWFWLPEDNIVNLERRHQLPYRAWAEQGLITLTPGNVIDYEFIRSEILLLAGQGECRKVLIDPYNATKLGITLKEQDGLPVEFVRQGFLSLSAPTKELERLILAGKLRHGGNPILRNHASNAVVVKDAAGNVKLHKEKSRKKIDGLAALVNAVAGLSTGGLDLEPSVYESRGLLFV